MDLQRLYFFRRTLIGLLVFVFWQQVTIAQHADSISTGQRVPAMQFQLFGGYGVNYIADRMASASFRIGVDVSFSHADSSGSTNLSSHSSYLSSGSSSSSSSQSGDEPNNSSTSYQISVSALSIHRLADFAWSSLGAGVGVIVSYSFDWASDQENQTTPGIAFSTNTNARTIESWGVGPLVFLGISNRILDHFCFTAELSLAVTHQWTTKKYTGDYESTYSGSPSSYQTNSSSESTKVDGWSFQLSRIRIGVEIDL
jgi:hypothetical protein